MRAHMLPRILIFILHGSCKKPTRIHANFLINFSEKKLFFLPFSLLHTNKTPIFNSPSALAKEKFNSSEDVCDSASAKTPLTDTEIQRVNELVTSLCQNGHLQVALELIDASLHAGGLLKSLNLDIFIDALCKERKMVHARKFINQIKKKGYNVDILPPIYRMLIDGYCKRCKLMEAMELLNEMRQSDDPHCYPDASVFATVVEGCCKVKRLFESIRILRYMLDRSFVPKSGTQMILFRSLLREARVREAHKLQEILGSLGEESVCSPAKVCQVVVLLDQLLDDWSD
eukprot:Gb_05102 [translate_table: standard]